MLRNESLSGTNHGERGFSGVCDLRSNTLCCITPIWLKETLNDLQSTLRKDLPAVREGVWRIGSFFLEKVRTKGDWDRVMTLILWQGLEVTPVLSQLQDFSEGGKALFSSCDGVCPLVSLGQGFLDSSQDNGPHL